MRHCLWAAWHVHGQSPGSAECRRGSPHAADAFPGLLHCPCCHRSSPQVSLADLLLRAPRWKPRCLLFQPEGHFLRVECVGDKGAGSQCSVNLHWARVRVLLEKVTLLPGVCLSGCLDQEESTTSHGPTRRGSMRLPKESVRLSSEQCWCAVAFRDVLFHGPRGQKSWESTRLCYWPQGL